MAIVTLTTVDVYRNATMKFSSGSGKYSLDSREIQNRLTTAQSKVLEAIARDDFVIEVHEDGSAKIKVTP